MNADERSARYQERSCPQCGYQVINRFLKKCPRCLGVLPTGALASACGSCVQGCAPAVPCTDDPPKDTPSAGNAK